tara:strand:+ start:2458 stop:2712 length:255 start_codon:yes stop_codon:yes gene_type:complete
MLPTPMGGDGMNINPEAIITRWESNGHNTEHPAYLIAKFMVDHDAPAQTAIECTRTWMAMSHYYKGPWSWAGVVAVLKQHEVIA